MQNAKQAYCNTFSDEYIEVAENNTQHGDCQIVLMEEDRLTEDDQVEFENENQLNNGEEIAEKDQCPLFPVSIHLYSVIVRPLYYLID